MTPRTDTEITTSHLSPPVYEDAELIADPEEWNGE